ncbi:quaternary amine ABC transporter ATP-binding protein [Gallaecimonas pentaromativorans]|uniref:Quaternary amine transport ATP-binding protein n=1 Tax=Gallaecimonas pentaromativorans TaxID=584787 RepID=A0A3N1P7C1_9GAMM|nr:glycine betaine/L-proline ABC transporter ATP-binding protein [Gallaecimonas pentaromativorans]MED5525125.1 glycine betaine/L-proline ABC transporter ATP-binding protein [Pseudomonadota bacterium]ROQ22660.1 glycine betaine/proline transport system ATP-binding protein [Gallaecimonas pentaromativorans]
MSDAILKVDKLYKVFGKDAKEVIARHHKGEGRNDILKATGSTLGLADISFEVKRGELLVIMGLSGSGKSTLLRCLNRLIEPSQGKVEIDGTDICSLDAKALRELRREKFGMVFQKFALMPHRTVLANTEFGLEVQGMDKPTRRQKAMDALSKVGLEGWENAKPAALSGGMQQRVGLARALAADPDILLMDEAFSALDPLIRRDMQKELRALQEAMHKTIIFITHDLDEALAIGDRIILLKDGLISQAGTPEEILTQPANPYVARFVEGVDMSGVLTAENAMTQARCVLKAGQGPRTALYTLNEEGWDHALVTDRQGTLVGWIELDAIAKALADKAENLEAYVNTDVRSVAKGDALAQLFPLFDGIHYPLPVVDEQQKIQGVVLKGAVLSELAGVQ